MTIGNFMRLFAVILALVFVSFSVYAVEQAQPDPSTETTSDPVPTQSAELPSNPETVNDPTSAIPAEQEPIIEFVEDPIPVVPAEQDPVVGVVNDPLPTQQVEPSVNAQPIGDPVLTIPIETVPANGGSKDPIGGASDECLTKDVNGLPCVPVSNAGASDECLVNDINGLPCVPVNNAGASDECLVNDINGAPCVPVNNTNNPGNGGGGGSSSSSGNQDNIIAPLSNGGGGSCVTEWVCDEWSACVDGKQTRTCSKQNSICYANLQTKPAETQICDVVKEEVVQEKETNFLARITGAVVGTLGRAGTFFAAAFLIGVAAASVWVSKKRKAMGLKNKVE